MFHPMLLQIVLIWELEQLQRPLSNGLKALVMVRYILPSRMWNTTSKRLVDADLAASQFLCMLHTSSELLQSLRPHSIRWDHRCYRPPDRDMVNAVNNMLRFRRSDIVRQLRINSMMTKYADGRLTSMGDGLVLLIHERWISVRAVLRRCSLGCIPCHVLACEVANVLLEEVPIVHDLSNATLLGRSASEPRIHAAQRTRVRARSLPRYRRMRIDGPSRQY